MAPSSRTLRLISILPGWVPRSQGLGRPYAVVWARRISSVDAVPTLAGDGCCRRSLLHGCYTWAFADVDRCPTSGPPGTGTGWAAGWAAAGMLLDEAKFRRIKGPQG